MGQVESAKVQKRKYGNLSREKGNTKVRIKAAYQCLVPYKLLPTQDCVLRPFNQRLTFSERCKSQIPGSQTSVNVAIIVPQ